MLSKTLKDFVEDIELHKEEILKAFVAKYGFEPDECEIVTQATLDDRKWFIRKRRNVNYNTEG